MTKNSLALAVLSLTLVATSCSNTTTRLTDNSEYASVSRFTDPGKQSVMLDALPYDPVEIAAIAKNLTVHHNLLAYHGVPYEEWSDVRGVWPPRATDALAALGETGPGDLRGDRQIKERLRGACMAESHLLATMLRYRQIPVRIRAGYFRNVYTNEEHVVAFWEENAREKGVAKQLLEEDPERWREVNHEYTRQQIEANKRVEHWVAEYWDEEQRAWRILDANNTFLKAMSGIDVGFHLPRRYFEYAYESWQKMRNAEDFNPDQYAEWPQDGRSHIRGQLLWDFYSLMNHDIAGYDKTVWPDDGVATAERDVYVFVKETKYEDVTPQELAELDALASLLSADPGVDELTAFYRNSRYLRVATIEADAYSFPARRAASGPQ
jgi:hypothetical protein